ncbi:MAG: hypothetical protein Q7V88_14755 [Actinomycetota bacterium]|nr:hypothetical protein [Actinomycetota bacterium]
MTTDGLHVRHVLTRKRAVLADSLRVVRSTVREMHRDRFLLRVVGSFVVVVVGGLILWRTFGKTSTGVRKPGSRSLVIGLRFFAVLCLQHLVASWLFGKWIGQPLATLRQGWRRLLPRLPAFAACAALLAWLDRSVGDSLAGSLARGAAGFGFSYVLSYAIPAAAAYRSGMFTAFRWSYHALRTTFGADLFAWSGVWLVNGAVALIAALPDAFDLYAPTSSADGKFSLAGKLLNWFVVLPTTMVAQAVGAAFVTVIFFALRENRAPAGFPKDPVETVSGLQLDD